MTGGGAACLVGLGLAVAGPGASDVPVPSLGRPVLVVLGVLFVMQVVLDVVALVVLARTPRERVRFGLRWPWVLVILLVNTVGAVVFLVVGRLPAAVDTAPPEPDAGSPVRRVVEDLYGPDRPS